MAFVNQIELSQDETFRKRVEVAAVKIAQAVQAEAVNSPSHEIRARLAHAVLHNSRDYALRLALGVAVNPAISASSTDSDIEFTVSSIWNAYAAPVV